MSADIAEGAFYCVFNIWSSEYYGHRKSIQICCCISIIGAAVMTVFVDIPLFIVSRFKTRDMTLEDINALSEVGTSHTENLFTPAVWTPSCLAFQTPDKI